MKYIVINILIDSITKCADVIDHHIVEGRDKAVKFAFELARDMSDDEEEVIFNQLDTNGVYNVNNISICLRVL